MQREPETTIEAPRDTCPKCGWVVDYGCGCPDGRPTYPLVQHDTIVVCPHCGDVTVHNIVLREFTCGNCDRPFETTDNG